jgi:hypothetical protein
MIYHIWILQINTSNFVFTLCRGIENDTQKSSCNFVNSATEKQPAESESCNADTPAVQA